MSGFVRTFRWDLVGVAVVVGLLLAIWFLGYRPSGAILWDEGLYATVSESGEGVLAVGCTPGRRRWVLLRDLSEAAKGPKSGRGGSWVMQWRLTGDAAGVARVLAVLEMDGDDWRRDVLLPGSPGGVWLWPGGRDLVAALGRPNRVSPPGVLLEVVYPDRPLAPESFRLQVGFWTAVRAAARLCVG